MSKITHIQQSFRLEQIFSIKVGSVPGVAASHVQDDVVGKLARGAELQAAVHVLQRYPLDKDKLF